MSVNLTVCSMEEFKNAKVYTMDEVCQIIASVQCQMLKHAAFVCGKNGFNMDEEIPRVKEDILSNMYKEHLEKEVHKIAEKHGIAPVVALRGEVAFDDTVGDSADK